MMLILLRSFFQIPVLSADIHAPSYNPKYTDNFLSVFWLMLFSNLSLQLPMEPLYHTDDVAWIQKKDSLANGEIGIFYLNGNTYIKELHDEPDGVYLISLNRKYRPIQVLESDSFKIFGKVIGKCKGAEIPGFH